MGGHGGINILGEKSWHVWTMRNRLRVERDQLQDKAQKREKKRKADQAVFDEKIAKMKRRAKGQKDEGEEEQEHPRSTAEEGSGSRLGLRLELGQDPTSTSTSSSSSGSSASCSQIRHMNFFEEEQREVEKHEAEHRKKLDYQRANNELARTGERSAVPGRKQTERSLSEFDEVANKVPWYLLPGGSGIWATGQKASASSDHVPSSSSSASVSSSSSSSTSASSSSGSSNIPLKVLALPDPGGTAIGKKKVKKEKKGKKAEKNTKKKKKKKNKKRRKNKRKKDSCGSSSSSSSSSSEEEKGLTLEELRQQREARERLERGRAANLLGFRR